MGIRIARPRPQRRLTGQRHALVVTSHQRLVMLLMLFAAGAVLIIARLTYLAAFNEPATSRDPAEALVPLRADIVDCNGEKLARPSISEGIRVGEKWVSTWRIRGTQ